MSFSSIASACSALRSFESSNMSQVVPVDDDIEMQLEHAVVTEPIALRDPEIHITPETEKQLVTIENHVLRDYITFEEHDFLEVLDPRNVPRFVMFERTGTIYDVLPESTFNLIESDKDGFKRHPITRQTIAESAVYRQSGLCELSYVNDYGDQRRNIPVERPRHIPVRSSRRFEEEGITAVEFFQESNLETGLRFLHCLESVQGRPNMVSVSVSELGAQVKKEVGREAESDVAGVASMLLGTGVVAVQAMINANIVLYPSGVGLFGIGCAAYACSRERTSLLEGVSQRHINKAFSVLYGSIESFPFETMCLYHMS